MVNRVDNRSQVRAAYESSSGRRKRGETDAPAFLLDDENGVIWERSDRKEVKKKDEPVKPRGNIKTEESVKAKAEIKEDPGFDFRAGFESIKKAVRSFFDGILKVFWYGDEKEEAGQNAAEELKDGSKDEAGDEMKLLKNTSIFTCYDRKGNITQLVDGMSGERKRGRDNLVVRPNGSYRKYL